MGTAKGAQRHAARDVFGYDLSAEVVHENAAAAVVRGDGEGGGGQLALDGGEELRWA